MCREKENSLDMEQFNAYYGLEEHLKAFRNIPLYEKLCCSWEVDKQKYINHISTSAHRFPHYSDHGESHSKKIVSSIEFILGKKRIKQLSVSDTWLLLQCAYAHDIGMSISANELFDEMAKDNKTYQKIKEICRKDDSAREAFEFVQPLFDYYLHKKREGEAVDDQEYFVKTNLSQRIDARTQYNIFISEDLSRWPLKLINAFSIILENYSRPRHGEFSEEMLRKDLGEVCENGIVPIRLRFLVARIASFHMKDRELLLETFPLEALGICNDYIHPRFAAIMLRLGDLLDLDNGRFNESQLSVLGEKPYVTLVHQFKHEAITHFLITPIKVSVKADFTLDMAENLLKKQNNKTDKDKKREITASDKMMLCMKACKSLYEWLQLLREELNFLSINWLNIVPRKFEGSCPYFVQPVLLINGRNVKEHELNLSYQITTKRAAEIIEGSGLYSNPQLTFLREILQNALDATKLQMYRDVMSGMYPGFYDDTDKLDVEKIRKLTPLCFCEKLKQNLNLYRIEYNIWQKPETKVICITIRDYGTGITYDDLTGMLKIGKSNKLELDQDISNMPVWLKPTGSFGIGLQSIFYVAKSFKIRSRAHFEKDHVSPPLREMEFFSTRMGGEIEVTLQSEGEARDFGYGTEVKIEIDFQDDRDKLLLYAYDPIKNHQDYFDVFNDDMKQIIKLYSGYLNGLYTDFIFPLVQKGKTSAVLKHRCERQNTQYYENQGIIANTFGDFCILTDHRIIKDCSATPVYSFSCWSEKCKILIKYKPCTTAYGYAPNFKLFYKGIRINSEKIEEKIHIPFWDTEIHLFSEYTNAILEISRDEILSEKVDEIVDSIHRIHLCCLKFIFDPNNMQLYNHQLDLIWQHGSQNQHADDAVEQEAKYLYAGKSYLSALMFYLSNRENEDVVFRNRLFCTDNLNDNKLMNCDKIAYYVIGDGILRRRFVERISELRAFFRIIQEEKTDIWFIEYKKLPSNDVFLRYPAKTSEPFVIVEDYFYSYPQFATSSFRMLVVNGWDGPIIIYKIVGRSGELVKADEKDFWRVCIRLFRNNIKNYQNSIKDKQRIRLVFPSNAKFEKISVTKLVKGIEHRDIIKFNSYIIAPLPLDKLEILVNKCRQEAKSIDKFLDECFGEAWIDENGPLLNHIDTFSVVKRHGNACADIDIACDVYLEYKTFLKTFLTKCIEVVE